MDGNLNGDTIDYTVSREAGENAGHYDVIPTGAASQGNYSVTYVNGDFEITKATTTLEVTGYNQAYDGESHGLTVTPAVTEGTTITYSVDGETWTTEAPSITNVGSTTYKVKATNANYNDVIEEGTLTVTQKAVTVTGVDGSKVYGEADPAEFTATVDGNLNGDTIDYTVSREAGENVGDYAVIPAGEASQGNYSVTYEPGTMTISKAELTVTAEDKSKTYGDTDPDLTLKVEGEKNNDKAVVTYSEAASDEENGETIATNGRIAVITGLNGEEKSFNVTLLRAEGENVNESGYAITAISAETLDNYTVVYVPGVLTVNQRTVTVKAKDQTRTTRLKDTDPELTADVEGLVNEDDHIEYSISREPGDVVGKYPITVSGAASQGNYHVEYVSGMLTITDGTDPLYNLAEVKTAGVNGSTWYRLKKTTILASYPVGHYLNDSMKDGTNVDVAKEDYIVKDYVFDDTITINGIT